MDHQCGVGSHEDFFFLGVLIWKLINMDQETSYCPQIIGIIFLGVSIDDRLEEFKMIEYLREYVHQ